MALVSRLSITRPIQQGDLNPVGMIVASMLTEAQFQLLNGTSWVLAYGQSVAGSTYASVTGNANAPDLRGRTLAARDDMGGAAASRITSASSGIDGLVVGSSGGNQTIAQHNHGSGTLVNANDSHSHTISTTNTSNGNADGPYIAGGVSIYGAKTFTGATANTDTHTHTISGNTASTGTGIGASSTHGNMPPTMIVNYFIKIN